MAEATLKQRQSAVASVLRTIKGEARLGGQFQMAARHLKDSKMFSAKAAEEAAWLHLFLAEAAALGAEAVQVAMNRKS